MCVFVIEPQLVILALQRSHVRIRYGCFYPMQGLVTCSTGHQAPAFLPEFWWVPGSRATCDYWRLRVASERIETGLWTQIPINMLKPAVGWRVSSGQVSILTLLSLSPLYCTWYAYLHTETMYTDTYH